MIYGILAPREIDVQPRAVPRGTKNRDPIDLELKGLTSAANTETVQSMCKVNRQVRVEFREKLAKTSINLRIDLRLCGSPSEFDDHKHCPNFDPKLAAARVLQLFKSVDRVDILQVHIIKTVSTRKYESQWYMMDSTTRLQFDQGHRHIGVQANIIRKMRGVSPDLQADAAWRKAANADMRRRLMEKAKTQFEADDDLASASTLWRLANEIIDPDDSPHRVVISQEIGSAFWFYLASPVWARAQLTLNGGRLSVVTRRPGPWTSWRSN